MNEWLLAGQVVLAYGAVVLAWRLFGRAGLYAWSVLASLGVYAVVQHLDVILYHAIWRWTERAGGNRRAWLWVRNNGSTLLSQLCNSVLFTYAAVWGTFSHAHPWAIVWSSLTIFVATSLLDTPFIYLCRRLPEGKL